MMQRFNKEEAIVFTTVQLYLKNRIHYLEELKEKASKHGFKIGVKICHGALYGKSCLRFSQRTRKSRLFQ